MIELSWLSECFNDNLEGGLDRANKLRWNLSVIKEKKIWNVRAGEALVFKTDSYEALEAFLYGIGLAYMVFPEDVFEQLEDEVGKL